jgi:hypothetical protein
LQAKLNNVLRADDTWGQHKWLICDVPDLYSAGCRFECLLDYRLPWVHFLGFLIHFRQCLETEDSCLINSISLGSIILSPYETVNNFWQSTIKGPEGEWTKQWYRYVPYLHIFQLKFWLHFLFPQSVHPIVLDWLALIIMMKNTKQFSPASFFP